MVVVMLMAVGVEGACRGLDRYGSSGGGDVGGRWVQRVRAGD